MTKSTRGSAAAGEPRRGSLGPRAGPEVDHDAKLALFGAAAALAAAMASARRLEIVDLLAHAERSVEEVALETHQSLQNASHHLHRLRDAGIVAMRRDGVRVLCRLASPQVEELWRTLRRAATALRPELPSLLAAYLGPDDVPSRSAGEVQALLGRPGVVLLDVRPAVEWRAAHVPAARSAPLASLPEVLESLPANAEVIAYCRGPWCAFAAEAVRWLRAHGVRASTLAAGMEGWREEGGPTESASDVPAQSH